MVADVVQLLEELLGPGRLKSKGNYAFHCPFCNHRKRKLEIHPSKQDWNCWVCGTRGQSIFSLLKRIGAKKHYYSTFSEVLPKSKKYLYNNNDVSDKNINCSLPKEYMPLWKPDKKNFFWKMCIEYLKSRGVTKEDILKYRIGYCIDGKYANMIIFPNYNKSGKLTYFTTRSFSRRTGRKFVNPPYSRDIVGFELQLNWELPVILVESALDAITVKRNASPLYGKFLSKALKLQILLNEVKDLYIALDPDARSKALEHAEYLMGFGTNVYFVDIPEHEDINSLGYDKTWQLIDSSMKLDNSTLFEYKLREML